MQISYQIEGTPNSPVLIFSNSLGADLSMWNDLVPLLLPYFRVLRYDTRGLGNSEVTEGEYSVEQLAKDVIDLADELKIDQFSFCGLSMGGLIAQELAISYPNRVKHIIIANSALKIGSEESWAERRKIVGEIGTEGLAAATMVRWFSADFIKNHPSKIDELTQMFSNSSNYGYNMNTYAIARADFREKSKVIKAPTLIITGSNDEVTNPDQAKALNQAITGSELRIMEGAKHLSATENPTLFVEWLLDFLVGKTTKERGLHVRRTVLGDEHVDRAEKNKNEFNQDFQEFISNYAWGEIWTRPGMNKADRSKITLALMIALNRKAEFQMHVKAAIHNGLKKDDIKEIIQHSAIYCGLPAANDAIHSAEEVFKNLGI
ncbi:MAG: hypothetical protein RIR51_460 [Bacteroidota bacterium]|jgi:3-oxoadipate enol-lactonase/4-carboxymuconolactone decarboxylase